MAELSLSPHFENNHCAKQSVHFSSLRLAPQAQVFEIDGTYHAAARARSLTHSLPSI